jgi:hypothetical protein
MASQMNKDKREVGIPELTLSLAYQLEAIVRILERKGLAAREEVLAEVQAIQQEQQKAVKTD